METPDTHFRFVVDDTPVTIRIMTLADRDSEVNFVRNLSSESRYLRFHSSLKELTPLMLERFTHVSYPENMALIATIGDGTDEKQIGVARYVKTVEGGNEAEVAIVVADDWQRRGVGARLLKELRKVAVRGGVTKLRMSVLRDNHRMLDLARKLGFAYERKTDDFRTSDLGKSLDLPPE